MTLRLGVVGAGVMGRKVAAAAAQIDGVRVSAVVDRDDNRATALARTHDAQAHNSIADLVDSDVVDAVYIGVPHHQHLSACLEAARAGFHVLIDKPLCNTLEEADQIMAARDAAGIKLMVGFSYRFRAEWIAARDAVAAGEIGAPRLVVDTIIEAETSTPGWYWDGAAGGGVLQLQSHHCFDRLAWVLGERFASVGCQVSATAAAAEDIAIINGTTGAGTLVSIDLGFGRSYRSASRATTIIQGELGHIVIDTARNVSVASGDGRLRSLSYADDDWLLQEVTAFVGLCTGAGGAVPGAEDGRAALACALAAARSARAGGPALSLF
jgi:predicted dehydrogenase